MIRRYKLDKTLRERRRIISLLDYLKRDDLTSDQMERIGSRLQKSGRRALQPLVRKLWREKDSTAIYRYTCMLDFFEASSWIDQLISITIRREDLDKEARLALLDALRDFGVDTSQPPFSMFHGEHSASLKEFVNSCLEDGERGLMRFMDSFIESDEELRKRMTARLGEVRSATAAELLDILVSFELPEVARDAVMALGKLRDASAIPVLEKAEKNSDHALAELARKSRRRLAFLGIEPPDRQTRVQPLPGFRDVMTGPLDVYGARTIWFSWDLPEGNQAAVVILAGESDGVINAVSYRVSDVKEYGHLLSDVTNTEALFPVPPGYAAALLKDALYRSRERNHLLPPDLYVDIRFFDPESVKPEAYIPRFNIEHLKGVVEMMPASMKESDILLDDPCLDRWIFSDGPFYNAAERLNSSVTEDGELPELLFRQEVDALCRDFIAPRRADIIKRLLLTADFMQYSETAPDTLKMTLATALSLVGTLLHEAHHPFVRRLVEESLDAARQSLIEGYDPRLEEEDDGEF